MNFAAPADSESPLHHVLALPAYGPMNRAFRPF